MASVTTILASQARSPNVQGYCCHIRYISLGITAIRNSEMPSGELGYYGTSCRWGSFSVGRCDNGDSSIALLCVEVFPMLTKIFPRIFRFVGQCPKVSKSVLEGLRGATIIRCCIQGAPGCRQCKQGSPVIPFLPEGQNFQMASMGSPGMLKCT